MMPDRAAGEVEVTGAADSGDDLHRVAARAISEVGAATDLA